MSHVAREWQRCLSSGNMERVKRTSLATSQFENLQGRNRSSQILVLIDDRSNPRGAKQIVANESHEAPAECCTNTSRPVEIGNNKGGDRQCENTGKKAKGPSSVSVCMRM